MGRWSSAVADNLMDRIGEPGDGSWLDVGCGTGDLTGTLLRVLGADDVVGVDSSPDFIASARQRWSGSRATFEVGSAEQLPFADDRFAGVASGLMLNFVPDPVAALREMQRVARSSGVVAGYVWDYDYGDFFLTRFWAALEQALGHRAAADERSRWPISSGEGLRDAVTRAGLPGAAVFPIVVETGFRDVDDLWDGFALGVGPSGVARLELTDDAAHVARAALAAALPAPRDGALVLTARAWAFLASPAAA